MRKEQRPQRMLQLNQDANSHSFHIKDDAGEIVTEGYYGVDAADQSALVLVTKTTILPTSHDQIDQLLSTIEFALGQANHACVFTWIPLLDGQLDLSQQKVTHKHDTLMMVDAAHLTYENSIDFDQQQYGLITNKEDIEPYAPAVKDMMRSNAYWAREWTEQEARDRIHAASGVVLLIDRANNNPCAFGRIFIVTANRDEGAKLAYMSDIAVSSQHQNKRLGLVVVNSLVKMFLQGNASTQPLCGTICLWCADQGVGAIAAPKLYQKFGFEFSRELHRRIALVRTEQFYQRRSL